ncbi:hypothetical protein CN074_04300 [Sinorhizobium medicae]|nr:hypothetical protein [Sinorhizobium medicae]RVH94471.1 hypothetical protein CN201_05380 [Sinorhizobium medicae]RVJ62977.1 hypothetical protein CN166_02665 [Sinorhizobium medicae]RVJ72028.1 hypothetical protein CN167_21880 [Sinorhizobium medicae]RVK18679.1 hypothetical protein CN165_14575 [Sinorhizobium medicae]
MPQSGKRPPRLGEYRRLGGRWTIPGRRTIRGKTGIRIVAPARTIRSGIALRHLALDQAITFTQSASAPQSFAERCPKHDRATSSNTGSPFAAAAPCRRRRQGFVNPVRRSLGNSRIEATGITPFHAFSDAQTTAGEDGMIKSGLGVTVAVLIVSVAVSGVLHFALSNYRPEAQAGVSGEITSSIPR